LIPILGSRTREQLDATLGALNVQLDAEQLSRLDGVSDVPKGVPHESISGSFARFSGGVTLDLPKIPVA
jgi:diketogulonate reductase-like aldo/keto reductase